MSRQSVMAWLSGVAVLLGGSLSAAAMAGPGDAHRHGHTHETVASTPASANAWHAADATLKAEFSDAYRSADGKRPVFAAYLHSLGVAAILDYLELDNPHCHGAAHDLGKALYASGAGISESLMLCGNRCTNACMHGVVAEAFGDRDYDDVVKEMDTFCDAGEMAQLHKPGNCAHGLGHALMLVTDHDLSRSLAGCAKFTAAGMNYYCATGVFMEYRDELDYRRDAGLSAQRDGLHYPCDLYPQYAAACYRYVLTAISDEKNLNGVQLIEMCLGLDGKLRRGCFHGLGATYSRDVADDPSLLAPLCLHGDADDQIMCIEGVIEKLADYDEQRAVTVCNGLDGDNKQVCLAGAHGKMYRLDKATMSLYR